MMIKMLFDDNSCHEKYKCELRHCLYSENQETITEVCFV